MYSDPVLSVRKAGGVQITMDLYSIFTWDKDAGWFSIMCQLVKGQGDEDISEHYI